jgi:hypothetical protein
MKYKNVNTITPNIRNNETCKIDDDNDDYSNNEFIIIIIPRQKNTFLNNCMNNLKNFEVLFSLTVFSLTSCRI